MKYHIHPSGSGVLEGVAGMAISTEGQYPLPTGWFASDDMESQGFLIGETDETTFGPIPANKNFQGYSVQDGQLVQVLTDKPIPSLSPRQMLIGLAFEGFITEAEAIAAASTGEMPSAVLNVVNTLPLSDQFVAKVTWARMITVEREHPLVGLLSVAVNKTPAEIDDFFRNYSVY